MEFERKQSRFCCCFKCHPIDKGQIEIHHDKGLSDTCLYCSFEHHTGDSTIWPISTQILREDTLRVVRDASHPFFRFHQSHERTGGRWLFRVSPCREGTINLQTSMSSPGFGERKLIPA
ncbi:hypothetical protein TNCV_4387011 [Trichonephila clavipes]|nr:hypothetical protein TNCV_4387011 [Trichonephila clavipes]